jgi:hypothetical protein
MASASGTMTVDDRRSKIKFETLRGIGRSSVTGVVVGSSGLCVLCGCTGEKTSRTRLTDKVIIRTHLLPIP